MELQARLPALEAVGIVPLALSYDSQPVLAAFATEHDITYPLLADEGSRVLRQLGLMHPAFGPDHPRHGVAQPATYLLGEDGRVARAIIHANQTVRDAWSTSLHDIVPPALLGTGLIAQQAVDGVSLTVALDSDVFRARQRLGLRVRLDLAPGLHVYGRPLPAGYTPVTLLVQAPTGVIVEPVSYPEARPLFVAGETLPVYTSTVEMVTHLILDQPREDILITVSVVLQACTDDDCQLPQQVSVTLPVRFVPLD